MNEALLKKRCRIPAALLLALLISIGVASATFVVVNESTSTNIREPISVTETKEFRAEMDPGTSNTWEFTVANNSETVTYDISFYVTDGLDDETGVSVAYFKVGATNYTEELKGDDDVVGLGDKVIDTLSSGYTKTVVIQINAETDAAAPQNVDLRIEIGRE